VSIAYEFTPIMLTSFYILKKVFCLSSWDLPTHSPHHPPSALLVPLRNSWCLGVHQGGFVMFIPLDIPCKSDWILNKIFRRRKEIGASSWNCWKVYDKWDILEVISSVLDPSWGRDWILNNSNSNLNFFHNWTSLSGSCSHLGQQHTPHSLVVCYGRGYRKR